MTREEATKMAYDMGAHPYSINGMVECLLKGEEMGRQEQKAIDEANPSDAVIMRILNAIGYEEESWIPIVRKNLEALEE